MNAVAHSSLSRVLIDVKASSTSEGSRPIIGYMPFCARFTASTLISSMVRSAFSCANAGLGTKNEPSKAATTDKRWSSVCMFSMSPLSLLFVDDCRESLYGRFPELRRSGNGFEHPTPLENEAAHFRK